MIADALRVTSYAPLEFVCADVDGNGVVNSADLGLVAAHFGTSVDDSTRRFDVNADVRVNAADLGLTGFQFNRRCAAA